MLTLGIPQGEGLLQMYTPALQSWLSLCFIKFMHSILSSSLDGNAPILSK